MGIWYRRYPSEQDVEENGLLPYAKILGNSPLKWVLLIFWVLAICLYLFLAHRVKTAEQSADVKVSMTGACTRTINVRCLQVIIYKLLSQSSADWPTPELI